MEETRSNFLTPGMGPYWNIVVAAVMEQHVTKVFQDGKEKEKKEKSRREAPAEKIFSFFALKIKFLG